MKCRNSFVYYLKFFVLKTKCIVRISKSGLFGESRPCTKCIERISKSGLRIGKIYYTTKQRTLVCEKISELEESGKDNYSTGYKYLEKIRGHARSARVRP